MVLRKKNNIIVFVVSDFSSLNKSEGGILFISKKTRTPDAIEPSESHHLEGTPFRVRTGEDYRR